MPILFALTAAQGQSGRNGKLRGVFLDLLFLYFYLTFNSTERIQQLGLGHFFEKCITAEGLLEIGAGDIYASPSVGFFSAGEA